ncbi:MAG: type II secretion system F family protein [Actinomycetota bacterium]|jgi:tight adherence protein C|nr:type II secretion system F family protein [Actinomycetota bacterium]
MLIVLVGALFLAGLAFSLVLRAALMPRMRTAETVEAIEGYGYAVPNGEANAGRGLRGALDDVAGLLGAALGRRLGGVGEAELRNELMAAGLYRLPPRRFLGYRVICVFTVPAAWLSVATTSGQSRFFLVVGLIVAVLAGWQAPLVLVRKRARRRLERIDYELPELIDLLVVTVEAGLGFNSSLQVAAERLRGPLGDEMRLALQEQSLGLPTDEALRNMLARADTPAMRSFVRSIIQGETLGVSIGDIMRNLAEEMRKRRKANAEERAQKAPIKILFPLIFMIFPAMFVVLLGPAAFQFIEAFGGR